jgi:hypothetical protein
MKQAPYKTNVARAAHNDCAGKRFRWSLAPIRNRVVPIATLPLLIPLLRKPGDLAVFFLIEVHRAVLFIPARAFP